MKKLFGTLLLPIIFAFVSAAETLATPVAEPTVPLYRYQTKTGLDAYAALPAEIQAYDKLGQQADDAKNGFIFFRRQRLVGHVYLAKQPGTLPLLTLFKDTDLGRKYFYTTDIDEAVILQKNGWQPGLHNKGIACYVATSAQPGAIPVYRLQQPDGVEVLYAFGAKERQLVSHLKEEKIAFYVWASAGSPSPDPKPQQLNFPDLKHELSVGDVKATEAKSVSFVIHNKGGEKPIPANTFVVQISAKKADGNFAWFEQQPITQAIKPRASTPVTVKTDHDMRGLKIQILVDALNKIEELNEQDNQSGFVDGPLFIITGTVKEPTVPSLPPPPAPTNVDFSFRPALYINGTETGKVNTTARYVTAGKTITVKKSEALSCDGNTCTFNLAFFVFRNNGDGEVATYALIRGNTIGIVGNTVSFQNGSRTRDVVFPCKLKVGENKLTVEVDPYKKTAESNENNNSFEVTIIVEP